MMFRPSWSFFYVARIEAQRHFQVTGTGQDHLVVKKEGGVKRVISRFFGILDYKLQIIDINDAILLGAAIFTNVTW